MDKIKLFKLRYAKCTLSDLMARYNNYTLEEKRRILSAYAFAATHHKGQFRASGDEYIMHPIAVACILCDLGADVETVVAGILHDVVEDCCTDEASRKIMLEIIKKHEHFGEEVAKLVEGVTSFRKSDNEGDEDKEDRIERNLQKVVTSITTDIRIVIIKLADRLHNMCTMEYKPSVKKAEETLQVFAPLAYLLGEYEMKCALEDLSFQYTNPEEYSKMLFLRDEYDYNIRKQLENKQMELAVLLYMNDIDCNFTYETKHLYGLRRRLLEISEHYDADDIHKIHDYHALNIILKSKKKDDVRKAYDQFKKSTAFGWVEGKDRDYLTTPKSNRYMGLHTTTWLNNDKSDMIQLQFKTPKMDVINNHGITAYWNLTKDKDNEKTALQDIVAKMQFYKQLLELQKENLDAKDYMDELRHDIFTKMIYIHNDKDVKHLVEMPNNSTVVDFAFRTNPDKANMISKVFVNDVEVPLDYKLTSQDHVKVIYGDEPHKNDELIDKSYAYKTRRLIKSIKEESNES